jgi:hypothetical protein
MRLRSGKLPFLAAKMNFFTIRHKSRFSVVSNPYLLVLIERGFIIAPVIEVRCARLFHSWTWDRPNQGNGGIAESPTDG